MIHKKPTGLLPVMCHAFVPGFSVFRQKPAAAYNPANRKNETIFERRM